MKRDNRPIHILLVEDNPGDALLVEEYLAEVFDNASLTQASTFKKAKDYLIDEIVPDAILLDLSLPDAGGIDLIEETMKIAGAAPVIVLTGHANLEFSVESLSRGISDYLLKDELSSTLLYKSIVYSIERNAFSVRLKESEKNYRELFELSPQPMMLFDLETLEILDVNRNAINHYGYSKDEFVSMTIRDIRPREDLEYMENVIRETKGTDTIEEFGNIRHLKKNGEIINVEIHANNIEYRERNARIVLINDVTKKRKEEERLKLLESVITNTNESVVIIEGAPTEKPGRKILYVNNAFTDMTGYERGEVLGETLNFLNGPATNLKEITKLRHAMDRWDVCNVEFINYRKDGTKFWIKTSMVPVTNEKGKNTHWVAIGRDISKQKQYEQRLRESLSEKEILLSEIHHRVKNNLAMISGLMHLQAFSEKNIEVEQKLYDSISRIQTMAAIHELLYKSDSFSKLRFSEIIEKLLSNIEETIGGSLEIEHEINVVPIDLNINQAVPCAIIINEVATNIYKHAFKNRKNGVIEVTIDKKKEDIKLIIDDNGVGLPGNFDPENTSTLGLHIIKLLADQLHAHYEFKRLDEGTRFLLTFTKSDIKGAGSAHDLQ